ncbi:unnamed protein product [Rotaria sp. Silwood1]|nr:unnamed protein product [Rotaria sp. Silwood1]
MSALRDVNVSVRAEACKGLGQLGEKAAISEVINRLLSALGDVDFHVRSSACGALGKMGEKAATNDVIAALMIALRDANDNVRRNACEALGQLGEKAATNEVIVALVTALGDVNGSVRAEACKCLGHVGEKATTNEVIAALMTALRNANDNVRRNACDALGQLGEKAATNRVINGLLCIANKNSYESLSRILLSASSLSNLDSNIVSKLFQFCHDSYLWPRDIPLEKIMMAYLDTKLVEWCPIIGLHSIRTGCSVTTVDRTIVVFGNSEPVKFNMPNSTLYDELVRAFDKQKGLPVTCMTDRISGYD